MIHLFLFVAGLVCLVVGANLLVRGASKLALSFGISPLVVGLTIVALGTSAPEIAVSVASVLEGKTDMAIGNVVGSNIFNVLFILGLSALIVPLVVHRQLIRQEVPIMFGVTLLMALMAMDGQLTPWEGGLLVALLVVYTSFLVVQSRRETAADKAAAPTSAPGLDEFEAELQASPPGAWDAKLPAQLALMAIGLTLLVLGSDWLVGAAVVFAKALGVSDVVIALTIVAAGTSMPEVATSIAAALKGERDIAVGNVVGSNIFNIWLFGHQRRGGGRCGLGGVTFIAGFRHLGHAGRGVGLPAHVHHRRRNCPLGGWRLRRLLRGLCVLFDIGGARARCFGRIQQRDAEFCGAAHRHHTGGFGGAQAGMMGLDRA